MADININLDKILKKKDNIAIAVMILIAVFIAKNLYQKQIGKANGMKSQIEAEAEKGKTLDRIIVLSEKIKKMSLNSWKTVDANIIIDNIYRIGLESNIKIRNIAPAEKKDEKNYVLIPVTITAETSYRNLVVFCKKLETFDHQIKIASVDAVPVAEKKEGEVVLSTTIRAEAVYIK